MTGLADRDGRVDDDRVTLGLSDGLTAAEGGGMTKRGSVGNGEELVVVEEVRGCSSVLLLSLVLPGCCFNVSILGAALGATGEDGGSEDKGCGGSAKSCASRIKSSRLRNESWSAVSVSLGSMVASSESMTYWNLDSPNILYHSADVKSGALAFDAATVANQSSKTTWN